MLRKIPPEYSAISVNHTLIQSYRRIANEL